MIELLNKIKELLTSFCSQNNISASIEISPDIVEISESDDKFHFYIALSESEFRRANTLYWVNEHIFRIGIAKRAESYEAFLTDFSFESELISFLFEQMVCQNIKITDYMFDDVGKLGMLIMEVQGGIATA